MSRPRVYVPDPIHPDGLACLSAVFEVEVAPRGLDEAAYREGFMRADATIVRNIKVDADLIAACRRLKVIAKHGAGYDNIDVAAASAHGVVVANVPGGNADAVAEGAVALMLAVLRRAPEVHRSVVAGDYGARWRLQFDQLTERTLGLVGIGNIGARVARICAGGFRMRVIAYDPALSGAQVRARGAEKIDDLSALLAAADIVSLHLPMTAETHHIINEKTLAAMKPTAILINAARGPLVDEIALARALAAGRIAGAGLDVYEVEPPARDNPILSAPNTVLSPHTTGNTVEAARNLAIASAEIILATQAGVRPGALINPEVWERRRAFA